MQNRDWSFLAQQTRDNNPLLKSQQFLQAAQGAGQAINQAGGAFTQAIKQKQIRQAGSDILGLMEQGQLNEQTMAGVLKKNRLGMQEAQEVIGLLQKSGAIAETKARTANANANTQATIGQEGRATDEYDWKKTHRDEDREITNSEAKARTAGIKANTQATIGKEGRDADEYTWKQGNRDADRDLGNREAESRINLNNANADYSRSGKASGNKPVDPADKVKDFIDTHPQIKALMTPNKEGEINNIRKDERDYYEKLAASEGFEIKFREEPETYWGRLPFGRKPGEIKIDEKTGQPKGAGNYFTESIVYTGGKPAANKPESGNTPPANQPAAALSGKPAGRYKVNGQIIAWDGTKVLN